jgi:invasion protein IalB
MYDMACMKVLAQCTRSALAGALLAGTTGLALAQPAAPPAPPQQTTATYEDWVVRCETRPGPPPQKTCEMAQFTQAQGQTGLLTSIAIGRPAKQQPLKMVVQVPITVWLPAGVQVTAGGKDTGVPATYKRCFPAYCFADTEIRDDVIRRFRTATENGKLLFKDANQKDVALPVSFKGFGTAFDALARE